MSLPGEADLLYCSPNGGLCCSPGGLGGVALLRVLLECCTTELGCLPQSSKLASAAMMSSCSTVPEPPAQQAYYLSRASEISIGSYRLLQPDWVVFTAGRHATLGDAALLCGTAARRIKACISSGVKLLHLR